MVTNLQGSSHRPRAVGFCLRKREDFIYENGVKCRVEIFVENTTRNLTPRVIGDGVPYNTLY